MLNFSIKNCLMSKGQPSEVNLVLMPEESDPSVNFFALSFQQSELF